MKTKNNQTGEFISKEQEQAVVNIMTAYGITEAQRITC